jgi:hypothetical protein
MPSPSFASLWFRPSPPGNSQYSSINDKSDHGAAYGATARHEFSVSPCAEAVDANEMG